MAVNQLQHHLLKLFNAQGRFQIPPELNTSLFLLDPTSYDEAFTADAVGDIWQQMPYWSFVWSSGHALAKFILQNPQYVARKRVMDFGSGSGVVGLTALKAGAKSLVLCDTDPLALKAGKLNASNNGFEVAVTDQFLDMSQKVDMFLVGDILYDTRNHNLANQLITQGKPFLWAESKDQTKLTHNKPIHCCEAETFPNIGGFDEHKLIHIYHYQP